jgi:hypothetical protein
MPFKGKYVLLDFADPLAHVAACRLRQLGAIIVDSIPPQYPNNGYTITCFVYNSSSSSATTTTAASSQTSSTSDLSSQQHKGTSKRSRMIIKNAAVNNSSYVDPPNDGEQHEQGELVSCAKHLGIKVIDFKQLNSLLRKIGEVPIDLEFQSGGKKSSPSSETQVVENPIKMRIYDEANHYLALEKVYKGAIKFAIDDPIPLIPPGAAQSRTDTKLDNSRTGTGTQLCSKTSQHALPRAKTKESGFCEVCNSKFAVLSQHIESESHIMLQEHSPVWKIIDDIFAECEKLQKSPQEDQSPTDFFKHYIRNRLHEMENMPMVYNFARRIIHEQDESRDEEGQL